MNQNQVLNGPNVPQSPPIVTMSHTRVEMNSSEQLSADDEVFPWWRCDVYGSEMISACRSAVKLYVCGSDSSGKHPSEEPEARDCVLKGSLPHIPPAVPGPSSRTRVCPPRRANEMAPTAPRSFTSFEIIILDIKQH